MENNENAMECGDRMGEGGGKLGELHLASPAECLICIQSPVLT